MAKYVVIMDTSGSMYCCKTNLKTYVNAIIDGLIFTGNEIALMSFGNDVHILSYYTNNAGNLNTLVDGLVFTGMTAFNDAILTGLVFENPRPDALLVFSDHGENASDASETDWSNLSATLGIDVILVPPSDSTYTCSCFGLVRFFTKKPITMKMAQANANAIAKKVKRAKVIVEPEDFLKLMPKQKK
jgi:hypothetical protein